jgi:hypothetical protein
MTKSLTTLIKLHRRKLDDMRKELVVLLSARDQCVEHLANLAHEMEEEKKAAATDEGRFIYANYLKHAKQRQARLESILRDAEEKIFFLEEGMKDEFAEVKKFEIMKARKEREIFDEAEKREREMLDEVGLIGYHRKEESA